MIGLFEALAVSGATAISTAWLWLCFLSYLDMQGLTEKQRLIAKIFTSLVMLIAVLLMFLVNVWVAPVILLAAAWKFPSSKLVVQDFIVNPVKGFVSTVCNDYLGLDKLDKYRYEIDGFVFYSDTKLNKVIMKRHRYSTEFCDENDNLIHEEKHGIRMLLANTTKEIQL